MYPHSYFCACCPRKPAQAGFAKRCVLMPGGRGRQSRDLAALPSPVAGQAGPPAPSGRGHGGTADSLLCLANIYLLLTDNERRGRREEQSGSHGNRTQVI